jgi:cytochrome c peroxidase
MHSIASTQAYRGLVAAVLICLPSIVGQAADPRPPARLRRPVALVLAENDKWLFVANRTAGTVSVIDTDKGRVIGESEVGRKLADLSATPDGKRLLAVDEDAAELLVLNRSGPALEIVGRVIVGRSPVSVRPLADGRRCTVASLWARELTVVDLAAPGPGSQPAIKKVVELPFSPRQQIQVPDTDKIVVADAFGGQIAVVDVARGTVESVRTLPAHQIRGLTWDHTGKHLLVSHQVLHADAHTTEADIHWGNLIVNYLRSVSRASLLNPDADLLEGGRQLPLGDVGHGTGDPAGVAVTADGTSVVALAGVGEVAIRTANKGDWAYVVVGQRPTAVALDVAGRRAFVADTFADRVTVVDVMGKKKDSDIALGAQPKLTDAERGELLFYDARLSFENWMSCSSCHVDGHTNGRLNDNLSDGSFGTPKRVLTLLGVKDTPPWAWNGGIVELKDQVRKSLEITMRGPKATDQHIHDLDVFLRTLGPAPPLRSETEATRDAVQRGKEMFRQQGCTSCHVPPAYTSAKTYDVGLADEAGTKLFNPPSLRGIGQAGPYFHDNRAATLEDVLVVHRHQLKKELSREELADLLLFLRSI